MHLVSSPSAAVPFGLQSSALRNAADIMATYEAMGWTGVELAVEPFDAPYGPWWVIRMNLAAGATMGKGQCLMVAQTAYIADAQPAVFA